MDNFRRNLLVNKKSDDEFVDLGLPSGLKWAKGNLKKSGNTCVIGEETDYGDFWSWANVGLTNSTGWMSSEGGVMSEEMYYSTTGASKTTNISGTDAAHDVAYKYLGTPWRLPTYREFTELISNTDREMTTINGIQGCKFMKKTDHSVYIFFPMSGYCEDNFTNRRNRYVIHWSSTCQIDEFVGLVEVYCMNIDWYGNSVYTSTGSPWFGCSIRPVQ